MQSPIVRSIVRPIARIGSAAAPAPLMFYDPFNVGASSNVTFTRATAAWFFNAQGLLTQAASGVPRIAHDPLTLERLGLLVEEARTNNALHNQDATNVVWVKTNMTAAKDQVGLDGVAASASSLTATAANGTCLQTFVGVSTTRTVSFYLKRLVGVGGVDITQDNGTTWTAATGLSSSVWTRYTFTQSVLNPVFGVRIQTSGDSVAMDAAQLENAGFALSPILTTTAAVVRNADDVEYAFPPGYNAASGTLFVRVVPGYVAVAGQLPGCVSIDDATANNRIQLRRTDSSNASSAVVVDGGATQAAITGSSNWTTLVEGRLALGYAANDFAHAFNGAHVGADAAGTVPSAPTRMTIGRGQGIQYWQGYIRQVAYWPYKMNRQMLQALTA